MGQYVFFAEAHEDLYKFTTTTAAVGYNSWTNVVYNPKKTQSKIFNVKPLRPLNILLL